ncbi:MAG: hypothetical protein ABIS14_01105 [Sphingomonas sp.]
MESNLHFYARRVVQEQAAARTALTSEARERRLALARTFQAKLEALTA